jgi:hypothetical protein
MMNDSMYISPYHELHSADAQENRIILGWGSLEAPGSCSSGELKLLFAEDERAETLDGRVVLPVVWFETRFLQVS